MVSMIDEPVPNCTGIREKLLFILYQKLKLRKSFVFSRECDKIW